MLEWSLAALRAVPAIERIVVALPEGVEAPDGTIGVPGGAERSHSVRNALAEAGDGRPGARPRRRPPARRRAELIERCLKGIAGADAAIAAARVTDTTKEAGPRRHRHPHARPLAPVGGPDAAGVHAAPRSRPRWPSPTRSSPRRPTTPRSSRPRGGRVRVVEAPRENLKVTTPVDLRVAELLLRRAHRLARYGRLPCPASSCSARLALLLALPTSASAATKWLCKPGLKSDVCDVGPCDDRVLAGRRAARRRAAEARARGRSTASTSTRRSATRGRSTRTSASTPRSARSPLYQAARYTQECRVYAPVYRQTTIAGIQPSVSGGGRAASATDDVGQADLREAWHTYLRRHNRGRGVVLIGHSQGTFRLRELIRKEIDDRPRVRRKVVSAILLGGNVVAGRIRPLPALPLGDAARLRGRLLDLRRDAARRHALRSQRRWSQRRLHEPGAAGRRRGPGRHDLPLRSRSRRARSSRPGSACSASRSRRRRRRG